MKIRDLINTLATAASDTASSLTMNSEVYAEHPDGGMSDVVASVYLYQYDKLDNGRAVAMLGGLDGGGTHRQFKPTTLLVGDGEQLGRVEQLEVALRDALRLAAQALDGIETAMGDTFYIEKQTAELAALQRVLEAN
jgi:hypothetical protein